ADSSRRSRPQMSVRPLAQLHSHSTTTDRISLRPIAFACERPVEREPSPASGSASRRRKRLLLVVLLALAGVVAYNHGEVTALRDRFIPKRWGVVKEGTIYRCGQLSRHLVKRMLEEHRIQRVVDLTFDNPSDVNHEAELAAIVELGIERRLCPLKA